MPHPIVFIGKLISKLKKALWKIFSLSNEREETKGKKLFAGFLLFVITVSVSTLIPFGILYFLRKIHPWLAYASYALEVFWAYQILAAKSLYQESMKVYKALNTSDTSDISNTSDASDVEKLEKSRYAVSMIVGRDTESLDEEGIIKATVETIAENTSDGEIAPLLFMAIFGVCGGFFYKAINTLDSMVGYKNDEYIYFGRVSAKMDDVANFIPARLSAFFMILASGLAGADLKNAFVIFLRDRKKHKSPNSAQTESVMAGALHVALAGDAWYFGTLYKKDVIGNKDRAIEKEDIKKANQIMLITSLLAWIVILLILFFIYLVV